MQEAGTEGVKSTLLTLDARLKDRIDVQAKKNGRTYKGQLRIYIEQGVERDEKRK